jgi:hypothetical protein
MTAAASPEFLRLVRSEWRKVRSLQFWWVLLTLPLAITAVSTFTGLGALVGVKDSHDSLKKFGDNVFGGFTMLLSYLGFFTAGALAILFSAIFAGINTSSEFQHKTIGHSFAIARSRDPVIVTKLLVTTAVGIGYGLVLDLVVVIADFLLDTFTSTTVEHSVTNVSVALGACLASIIIAILWTWIGAGLGLLTGSPLSTTLAQSFWSFPVEPLVWLIVLFFSLSGDWTLLTAARVLPIGATVQTIIGVAALFDRSGRTFTDGIEMLAYGLPSLLFWASLSLGLGWWRARNRDIT